MAVTVTRITCDPAYEGILSWGARGPTEIDLRVQIADGRRSEWLPYVRRDPWRSCSSRDDIAKIEVDVIRPILPLVAVEVRADAVEALFLATPPREIALSATVRALTRLAIPCALEIPAFSQYVDGERGWCAAASLAMIMTYWAKRTGEPSYLADVRSTAAGIYDAAYSGTGNWTFGTAFAHTRGLMAAVAYLPDLDRAHRFLLSGIPLVISLRWEEGELTGAPLPRTDGHLLVLRGFDREGYALVNDPALPEVAGRYRRDELEAAWMKGGGIAYVTAPPSHADALGFLASLGQRFVVQFHAGP
jgi:hypothetical protein